MSIDLYPLGCVPSQAVAVDEIVNCPERDVRIIAHPSIPDSDDGEKQHKDEGTEARAGKDSRRESQASAEPIAEESVEDAGDELTQQWLRRIPDDPGGLLRRKFQYQYRQKYQGRPERNPW